MHVTLTAARPTPPPHSYADVVRPALQDIGAAPPLSGLRLDLEPLQVAHAVEMAPLLDDRRLHVHIGGEPATPEELQEKYARQAVGWSPDGRQRWLNWISRRRADGRAVGIAQATVTETDGVLCAEIGWLVVSEQQGQGYATEAARLVVAWLRGRGVGRLIAHIHPRHGASQAVARALGLAPTQLVVDGEVRWLGVEP